MLHSSPQKTRTILLIILFLACGAVASIFIGFRILSEKPDILIQTLQDNATLSLQNLHQTATRNGKPEWTLDAESARLIHTENRSILENLSIVFFMEPQPNARLTARHGTLENDSNNFTVSGDVVLTGNDYTLRTEELRYDHAGQILFTERKSRIQGKSLEFTAQKITFNLQNHQARLEGNVEGVIRDSIIF